MNELRLIIAYIFSLLILSSGIFVLLNPDLFQWEHNDLDFYVKISSIFMISVSFFLFWYYANILIRQDILARMKDFGNSIISADFEKISKKGISKLADEMIIKLEIYENSKFEFFGFCIPFFVAFLVLTVMGIIENHRSVLSYFVGCTMSVFVVKFANILLQICDIKANTNGFINTIKNLTISIRSIQFYNSTDWIKTKIRKKQKESLKETEKQISKAVWRSFVYVCLFFVVIVAGNLVRQEYIQENLFNIEGIEGIYLASIFTFFMFLVSFFRSVVVRKIKFINAEKYQLPSGEKEQKKINAHDIFIAFHGVYFQDPTRLSEHSLINDLTFSVLPGEFVAITGENSEARSYIFDLILKFYKVQSGQIYIAGSKIESLSRREIRSIFGILEEDFGLIEGTIYENLELITSDSQKIDEVAEKFGLDEVLGNDLYDNLGKIQVSQEMLLRLQFARIVLQKPKVLLAKTPEAFESELAEEIFYDFIEYCSKKMTILLVTDNPSTVVYSDKILYLSKNSSFFGSHAELSKHKEYQKFMNRI